MLLSTAVQSVACIVHLYIYESDEYLLIIQNEHLDLVNGAVYHLYTHVFDWVRMNATTKNIGVLPVKGLYDL